MLIVASVFGNVRLT